MDVSPLRFSGKDLVLNPSQKRSKSFFFAIHTHTHGSFGKDI